MLCFRPAWGSKPFLRGGGRDSGIKRGGGAGIRGRFRGSCLRFLLVGGRFFQIIFELRTALSAESPGERPALPRPCHGELEQGQKPRRNGGGGRGGRKGGGGEGKTTTPGAAVGVPGQCRGSARLLEQQLRVGGLGLATLAHSFVSQQPVCPGEALWQRLGRGAVMSPGGGGVFSPLQPCPDP